MKTALVLCCLLAGNVYAANPVFSTLLSGGGQDFATALTSDSQGNTYVVGLTYSADFPVTAGAYQTTFGQTCDAFIAKVGPDGKVVWSTYLGGVLDDFATGVALDNAGNVLVTGYTRSPNFPLVNPIQSTFTGFEAFVAKFDPTGAKLLYSTILSGQGETGGAGITVDSAGNAYIAANTLSAPGYPGAQNLPALPGIFVSKLTPQGGLAFSYFHPYGIAAGIALDAAGAVYVAGSSSPLDSPSATQTFGASGLTAAMVFKLSPDGSKKIYETTLGGGLQAAAAGIAVQNTGEVWIAGRTSSADFPLVHPLQNSLGARPLWKTTNSGAAWVPVDNLPFALPQMVLVDPSTPNTLYVANADLGIFKSLDAGATWTSASAGLKSPNVRVLAISPINTQILYSVTAPRAATRPNIVYKSVDGGTTWSVIDSPTIPIAELLVDPLNPNNIYQVDTDLGYGPSANIRKSTDGGATWTNLTFPATVQSLVLDPHVSGAIVAVSNQETSGPNGVGENMPAYFYRSVDGGATWVRNQTATPSGLPGLVIDGSTNPSTVYDGLAFRSTDGGVTWSPLPSSPASANTLALAVDSSGALYAASANGLFISHDLGQTFSAIGAPAYPAIASLVPAGSGGTVYATIRNQTGFSLNSLGINSFYEDNFLLEAWTSGFVSKLSADGATLEYSTYLGGHPSAQTSPIFISEPDAFQTQNWISGIALDAVGNVVVAGGTRATDFPTANPLQPSNAGLTDAFAAILSADGSKLNYSTYLGGSQDDGALAMGLDQQGNIILAGQTWSGPFSYGDGFVAKLAPPAPPAITSVLNAASFQPGIEAGSWVMIQGTHLADTNPGRTWTNSDFVGNSLPQALDGVSVTIDGKPAFVEYISPTQINVQAPADSAVGAVNVVVNNNGAVSAPAPAQLQALAPAFFMYGATNFAAISRLPDYATVGNSTVPANPGDTVVLWGTGFGATNPAASAGTVVNGAFAVVPVPRVTVGGMSVPVISALLTPGSAGLYQLTIQLPANTPTGALPIQASIGTVQTPSGVMILVANH